MSVSKDDQINKLSEEIITANISLKIKTDDLIKTKNKLDDIIQSLGLKENMLNTIKVEFDNTIELLNKKEID